MRCFLNLWPDGKHRCLTLSYDDGHIHDRRLVDICNRYGVRGSFHLNAGGLGRPTHVSSSEVAKLYAGHEVSAHTFNHPFPSRLPRDRIIHEILEDRRVLEDACGYPVRGMSYPFGQYSRTILDLLPTLGIEYGRTVASHEGFHTPENLLTWHPTCHHGHPDLVKIADRFLGTAAAFELTLLYVWGHSYEFENAGNWHVIEDFCRRVGGDGKTWYATNIEISDYLRAIAALRFSVDGCKVYNPSARSVWLTAEETPREIPPGQSVHLAQES